MDNFTLDDLIRINKSNAIKMICAICGILSVILGVGGICLTYAVRSLTGTMKYLVYRAVAAGDWRLADSPADYVIPYVLSSVAIIFGAGLCVFYFRREKKQEKRL